MIPIQVVIESLHVGTHTCEIRNVWDFVYEKESRTLALCAYRKYYKADEEPWICDTKVMPEIGADGEEKLLEALGGFMSYDRMKVLAIAKAKCLEADVYMKFNEMDCISLVWVQPMQPIQRRN